MPPANKAVRNTKGTTNRMSSSTTAYSPTTATNPHTVTDVMCWTDMPYAKTSIAPITAKSPCRTQKTIAVPCTGCPM